jgi:hypothetical protein
VTGWVSGFVCLLGCWLVAQVVTSCWGLVLSCFVFFSVSSSEKPYVHDFFFAVVWWVVFLVLAAFWSGVWLSGLRQSVHAGTKRRNGKKTPTWLNGYLKLENAQKTTKSFSAGEVGLVG